MISISKSLQACVAQDFDRQKLAAAIVDGVRNYFSIQAPPGTWMASHATPGSRQHVVGRGESLSLIAQRHGVSVAALRAANGLKGDMVKVGDKLKIPLMLASSAAG